MENKKTPYGHQDAEGVITAERRPQPFSNDAFDIWLRSKNEKPASGTAVMMSPPSSPWAGAI
jgi:hypothetical protein